MHHVWKSLNRPEFGLVDGISELIRRREWEEPDALTSLRRGPSLIVACDYGGSHSGARYESLSFLLADAHYCWLWDELRNEVRRNYLRDSRRMSFKQLGDRRRASALVPFLRAANSIPGLLATFLIDKRIQTLFQDTDTDVLSEPVVDPRKWNPKAFERLCRVGHLGALLIAGLSAPGQNILWLTDEDDIVPNVVRHIEATRLIEHISNHYLAHPMGKALFGTTRSDDGSLGVEDLVAIPDLVAGAVAEVMTSAARNGLLAQERLLLFLTKGVSKKAHAITSWLADGDHPLRRLTFHLDWLEPDGIGTKLLTLQNDRPLPEYDWRGDFLRITSRPGFLWRPC